MPGWPVKRQSRKGNIQTACSGKDQFRADNEGAAGCSLFVGVEKKAQEQGFTMEKASMQDYVLGLTANEEVLI